MYPEAITDRSVCVHKNVHGTKGRSEAVSTANMFNAKSNDGQLTRSSCVGFERC
jgi:hypothetical protein